MTGVEIALIAGAVIAAAGTAVQAYGAHQQAKYQASVAEMNMKIQQDNAKRATDRAFIEGQEQDRINAGIFGEQINAQGGSGLSAASPSFALARRGARTLGRLDTLNVVQSGLIDAHNARVGAAQSKADAGAFRAAGRNALISGGLQATGQLASGLGGAFGGGSSLVGGSTSSIGRGSSIPRSTSFTGSTFG